MHCLRLVWCSMFVVLCFISRSVHSQEHQLQQSATEQSTEAGQSKSRRPRDNRTLFESVKSYFDEQTLGVLWFDLDVIDFAALENVFKQSGVYVSLGEYEKPRQWCQDIQAAGIERCYLLLDVASLTESRTPLAIMEIKSGADMDLIKAKLVAISSNDPNLIVDSDGSMILMGRADLVESKKRRPAVELHRLNQQLAKATAPIGCVIAPSESMSEALRMTMLLGAGDIQKLPIGLQLLLALTPMEGLRCQSNQMHLGGTVVVEFKKSDDISKFIKTLERFIQSEYQSAIPSLMPVVAAHEITWNVEGEESLEKFLAPIAPHMSQQSIRTDAMRNLRQITLALNRYQAIHDVFPAQALVSKDGKRLLSWRVILLPYLNETELYQQFKLDEPWDSDHNLALISKMPKVYARPNTDPKSGKTPYVGLVTQHSLLGLSGNPVGLSDIVDGAADTIWGASGRSKVEMTWTKPEDWEVTDQQSIDALRDEKGEIIAAFVDGSVQVLSEKVTLDSLLKLLSIDGGETVERK